MLLLILCTIQVKHVASKGGRDIRDAVKRMMTECFSPELAVKLNWTGQGGKQAFSKLKLADVIRSK